MERDLIVRLIRLNSSALSIFLLLFFVFVKFFLNLGPTWLARPWLLLLMAAALAVLSLLLLLSFLHAKLNRISSCSDHYRFFSNDLHCSCSLSWCIVRPDSSQYPTYNLIRILMVWACTKFSLGPIWGSSAIGLVFSSKNFSRLWISLVYSSLCVVFDLVSEVSLYVSNDHLFHKRRKWWAQNGRILSAVRCPPTTVKPNPSGLGD